MSAVAQRCGYGQGVGFLHVKMLRHRTDHGIVEGFRPGSFQKLLDPVLKAFVIVPKTFQVTLFALNPFHTHGQIFYLPVHCVDLTFHFDEGIAGS